MKAANGARRVAAMAALAGVLLSALPVSAAEAEGVLQSCWTPDALAGRPDEKHARLERQQTSFPATKLPAATPGTVLGTVRRVKLPPGRKLVAITFDLCESGLEVAGYDGGVIDYLRAQKVKATLFAGGKWIVHHPERAAQLIADPLFEIGTHGWSHANLHMTTGEALDNEIGGAVAAHAEARRALGARACAIQASADLARIPAAPKLFRFPFGTCTPEALASVASQGQLAIQWDVVSGDPDRHVTPDGIARAVLAETKPGSIIVAHANGRGLRTAEALPMIVPQLRARGFEFVTVGELLAAGTPEVAQSCYERRPGDNIRYDMARLRKEPQHPVPIAAPVPAVKARQPAWTAHTETWP
jgi:peptidoglycan/xylan/chitin deacetylase (PgdA/CDA1 family)